MSRVASNHSVAPYTNGASLANKSTSHRSSTSSTSVDSITGRSVNIRSAAPPPAHKETVHACPLCNSEYKDPRVLPCTHTYCCQCIREKLIKNNRVTCPKCHYQVHPFEEAQLQELPRNLILSQEWRIGARPVPFAPAQKAPVAYQSNVAPTKTTTVVPPPEIPQKQDKHRASTVGTNGHGIHSLAQGFHPASESAVTKGASNPTPQVSNLIKIYSEATIPKPPSLNHHDELARIVREAGGHRNSQAKPSSTPIVKQPPKAHDEEYEEMTWESLIYGPTPVAPPFPQYLQSSTVNQQHHPLPPPPKDFDRPKSSSPSEQNSNIDHLQQIVAFIHQQPLIGERKTPNRSSLTSDFRSRSPNADARSNGTSVQQQHQPMHRKNSSTSRHSPVPIIINEPQPRSNGTLHREQQDNEKVTYRTHSPMPPPASSSSVRRSSERLPSPPIAKYSDTLHVNGHEPVHRRSPSPRSNRSSVHADTHEQTITEEAKFLRTERFNPETERLPGVSVDHSSQILSTSSTPTHRSGSISVEHERPHSRSSEHYLSPTHSSSTPHGVTSRVDLLLSDQKRLEHEIAEQIKRLKYDYDDIRQQIDRKQSSIHAEVKNIAAHLDDDITTHYRRKQQIYQDLAADTSTVGNELERLKGNTDHTPNNKQQLWDNLQQIESNIRTIRQAVDQYKDAPNALTFAEGRRTLAADTLGQLTYPSSEPHSHHAPSTRSPRTVSPSHGPEPSITNLSPYKYLKVDHLSNLEPEAIAITENNKKILLGICNKLFILNEYGATLKTIIVTPSIRGIAVSKNARTPNIAYVSHDETVSMIDIDSGHTLDCVKETDSNGESGTFLPLGIDTDQVRGNVYVCDYRNSCLIKFDDKLEFMSQWRVYNHSEHYDEARPKLISIHGQNLYMIVEHSCKSQYNGDIAYTFSLHICDVHSGNIIKIVDADLLSTQRLRWPCSVQAIGHDKCYILDTMTSGKYFNGQWQKHWSRVLEIGQHDPTRVTELFQLDSEASTMAMNKQSMVIAANGEILFVRLDFLQQENGSMHNHRH